MDKLQEYNSAKGLPNKERVRIYNRLIEVFNADTGNNLKKLTTCGSCVRDFESYKPFQEWVKQ
jgi:hypothetical protein